jgi:antitoxin component YwqK of YwqJK toxin-antitoxin module
MKRIITFVLLTFSVFSFSQEVEKMQKRTKYGQAVFYVLKSDMTTKHGKYTITSNNIVRGNDGKAIMVEGNYNYGKKDGFWTKRYFMSRGKIQSQGNYENDIQVGKWTFYEFNGEIVQEYDFDNHKLLMTKECGTDKEYVVYIEDIYMKSKLDCPPSYIGGYEFLIFELNEEISTSFKFSRKEEGGRIKIVSNVSFFLKKDGVIENIEFRQSMKNEKLKKFIENKIHDKQGKWIVAELNGSKIDSKVNIPIKIDIRY